MTNRLTISIRGLATSIYKDLEGYIK
jgi:hypothetical protein